MATLSELLFSALLWGSVVTWVLWWFRKQSGSAMVRKLLWLPLGWFGFQTVLAWYGFLLPPSGRLVDDASGQPIPSEFVSAQWIGGLPVDLRTSTCSGYQTHRTDGNGRFSFRFAPATTLFSGMLLRGINSEVGGYVNQSRFNLVLLPLLGDLRLPLYVEGQEIKALSNAGLGRKQPDRFETIYIEACLEQFYKGPRKNNSVAPRASLGRARKARCAGKGYSLGKQRNAAGVVQGCPNAGTYFCADPKHLGIQ